MKRFTQNWKVGVFCALCLMLVASASLADQKAPEPAKQQTTQTIRSETAPAPSALTQEEVYSFQMQHDSLTADSSLQNMAVGAGVDGTTVLSVLVALLIFAVIVAVL